MYQTATQSKLYIDYQGARTAKAIVDAVVERIPNHVTRLTSNKLNDWLVEKNGTTKAVLFTEKGTTSALYRALAIEFLGRALFAQIRDKEEESVNLFGVNKFPTLIVLPGGEAPGKVYEGIVCRIFSRSGRQHSRTNRSNEY